MTLVHTTPFIERENISCSLYKSKTRSIQILSLPYTNSSRLQSFLRRIAISIVLIQCFTELKNLCHGFGEARYIRRQVNLSDPYRRDFLDESTYLLMFSKKDGYSGYDEESVAGSTSVSSRDKKFNARIQKKRKKKRKLHNRKHIRGNPITEDEVAQHVSSRYVNGPGGILFDSVNKRKRQEASSKLYGTDKSHKDQVQHLKKLDMHPALVLNADYQVIFFNRPAL